VKPEQWLAKLEQICSNSDWVEFSRLRKTTNQRFASTLDYDGLSSFYEELIELGLDDEKRSVVRINNIEGFQSSVAAAFGKACSRLSEIPNVKGVYFEYFYDAGDSCLGRVYLCEAYSDDDDGWGAEYYSLDAMVDGPDVSEFLNFDQDFEWDDYPRYVAEEYVNGRFLAAVLEEWQKSGIKGLPFGFAEHDHKIVRAPANEEEL